MKKRILITLALVGVLALTTIGASAYFNSQQTTTGNISSGTLTLKLGEASDGPWEDTVALPWDFSQMAPGDEVSGKLWMKNTGTIDAAQVTFEWDNIINDPATKNLADHIFLKHVWDSKNTVDAIVGVTSVADAVANGGNGDGETSLSELAALSGRFGLPYDAVSDVDPFLRVDSPQYLYMAFQFDPAAGNELQGIDMTYNLVITAEQVVVWP